MRTPCASLAGPKVDDRPDWSPDGERITFSRNGNIWVMDDDGGNETKLTDTRQDEFSPAFSPNGQRIAFNRLGADGRIGIWVMREDGTVSRAEDVRRVPTSSRIGSQSDPLA